MTTGEVRLRHDSVSHSRAGIADRGRRKSVDVPSAVRGKPRARASISRFRAMGSGSGSDAPAPVRTIEDVAKEDAGYRARDAETPAPAPELEAAAMKTLLTDASVCDRCVKAVGQARWVSSADTRMRVLGLADSDLGMRVVQAVDDLDAPHLRPTSIRKRLEEGVDASCHSLVTLLANVVTRDR